MKNSFHTKLIVLCAVFCLPALPLFSQISGCTDSAACNFDPAATIEDESCLFIGEPCNDGDLCTINDVVDSNCDCAGAPKVCLSFDSCNIGTCVPATGQCVIISLPDSDGDGICDAEDSCPNTPGEVGDPCPNADACTTNSVIDANCNCTGTPLTCVSPGPCYSAICNPINGCVVTALPDSDGDGICDAEDSCPSTPGEIGDPCPNADACTTNSVIDSDCNCTGTPLTCVSPGPCYSAICNPNNGCVVTALPDSDGDGICDAEDSCPNTPGEIGDPCPNADLCTINSVIDADCNCTGTPVNCVSSGPCFTATCDIVSGQCFETALPDSDGDGLCDAEDSCPNIPGEVGDPCDDLNIYTDSDAIDASCNCVGTAFDSDNDGLTDDDEINIWGSDPFVQDTDGDGLTDGLEVNESGTDPTIVDTDGDGCNDNFEYSLQCPDSPDCSDCPGDFNMDDIINTSDLLFFLSVMGSMCP